MTSERRSTPRTTLQRLAYIQIEPDNGGIVLNVSEDGIGFHSMNAIENNGPLRLSLQEQNRRIDVSGELMWTDEVQKCGGVKFTTLTTEARSQIRDWISRPEIVDEHHSTVGAAFLRAFPGMWRETAHTGFAGSFTAARAVLKARTKVRLSGFSGGLLTGVLVSIFVIGLTFLGYGYRHQFGESLIRWGERLVQGSEQPRIAPGAAQGVIPQATRSAVGAAKTSEAPLRMEPAPKPISHEAKTAPPAITFPAARMPAARLNVQSGPIAPTPLPVHRDNLTSRNAIAASPISQSAKFADTRPATLSENVSRVATPDPKNSSTAASEPHPFANLSMSAVTNQPETPKVLTSPPSRALMDVVPPRNLADFAAPQMFFDLGKFKQRTSAQDFREQVAQLGFPTSIVQRGHLWMNSFQVLVGPYTSEVEEKKINVELLSRGYKPKPFERGSRGFSFRSQVSIEGTRLPAGDLDVSWESYVTDAKVKFTVGRDEIVSTSGRWRKQERKYANNEYVYLNQPGGHRPLVEIHFAGMDRALVFRSLP